MEEDGKEENRIAATQEPVSREVLPASNGKPAGGRSRSSPHGVSGNTTPGPPVRGKPRLTLQLKAGENTARSFSHFSMPEAT
jgi:hypothetical protein